MPTSRSSSGASRSSAQRVLRVALRLRRIFVHFEEDAVDAGADAGARERLDVLGEARGHAVAAARQLQAVRDVEDDRRAEARASSGTRACRRPGCCSRTRSRARSRTRGRCRTRATLSIACRMSSGARNWPFLRLTTRPVRAAATIRSVCRERNAGICRTSATSAACARLPRLVDVRQDRHAELRRGPGRAPRGPSSMPGPAERRQRRAVGFVERRLEDVGHARAVARCRRSRGRGRARAPRSR